MAKRNEHTSPRVATIAGKILAIETEDPTFRDNVWNILDVTTGQIVAVKWRDIRSIAASALTQANDKVEAASLSWYARGFHDGFRGRKCVPAVNSGSADDYRRGYKTGKRHAKVKKTG